MIVKSGKSGIEFRNDIFASPGPYWGVGIAGQRE